MSTPGSDELIKTIRAALLRDARVNLTLSQLDIRASGQQLILEGSVENIAVKRIAADFARQTTGAGYSVEDRLRINTQNIGDAALRDKIVKVLTGEPVFRDYRLFVEADGRRDLLHDPSVVDGHIMVSLQDGVISLHGEVASLTHWRLAEALIWWIPGCQRIDNHLQVVPPERDSDDELTDAVKIVLEKDPLVHAGQIRVGSAAGVVELGGQLASEPEHMLALRDAWAVPGVWEVNDHIEVGSEGIT